MDNKKTLDISWGTILKISVTIIFLYFLYLIRSLIIWFIFALVISILLEPAIRFLNKRKIPRVIAVIFIYFFIFGILVYSFYLTLPFFASEFYSFSQVFPQQISGYFEKISPMFEELGMESFENLDSFLVSIGKPFEEITGNIFGTIVTFFGGIFAAFFTISIAFFLSLEKGLMEKGLVILFPKKYEDYLLGLWNKSKEKVTGWFLMRIIGVLFVGLSSYVAFRILGINYPASFAVIAGVFDFIPILGPWVAAILIFIAVSLDSFLKAIFVLLAFVLIQLIENTVLLPILSKKIIKVSPVLVLIALFIGGSLWGVLGAILLVPLVAILFDFLKNFLSEKKEELFSGSSSKEITKQEF